MRQFPTDKYGQEVLKSEMEDLKKLNAEYWQVQLLKLNPSYTSWGPGEDYMDSGDSEHGWSSSKIYESWSEFGPWGLDELNEVVNFYFKLERDNHECQDCEGTGHNQATLRLYKGWYGENYRNGWMHRLEKEEVEALFKAHRLPEFKTLPTPEQVNSAYKTGFGHDCINMFICLKTRAEKLGVYGKCPTCNGDGILYDSPKASVGLVLWYLHPRKGCSRGVEIKKISQKEVPEVLNFLKEAADRNAGRFSKILKV